AKQNWAMKIDNGHGPGPVDWPTHLRLPYNLVGTPRIFWVVAGGSGNDQPRQPLYGRTIHAEPTLPDTVIELLREFPLRGPQLDYFAAAVKRLWSQDQIVAFYANLVWLADWKGSAAWLYKILTDPSGDAVELAELLFEAIVNDEWGGVRFAVQEMITHLSDQEFVQLYSYANQPRAA